MRYQTIAVQFRCGFTMIQRRVQCGRICATLRGLLTVPIPSNGAERCQLCRPCRAVQRGQANGAESDCIAAGPESHRIGILGTEASSHYDAPRVHATRPMYTFVYPEPSKSPFAHDFRIFYPIIQPVGTFSFRRCEPAVPFRPSALRCIS